MIHVVVVVTAKPGQGENVLQAFRANAPTVLAEQGCIEYAAVVDAENAPPIQAKWGADTLLAIEKWENMDALKAHAASPHMAEYAAKTRDLIVNRAIYIMSPA